MNNDKITQEKAVIELITNLKNGLNSETKIFTSREQKIFNLVSDGLSNLEISDKLFISINTVKRHKASLMSKLGVKGQCDLRKFLVKIKKMVL